MQQVTRVLGRVIVLGCLTACVDPEITDLEADPLPTGPVGNKPDELAICRKTSSQPLPPLPPMGLDNLSRVPAQGDDDPCLWDEGAEQLDEPAR